MFRANQSLIFFKNFSSINSVESRLKASFRGLPKKSIPQIKNQYCLVPISVGYPRHENEDQFRASMKLINEYRLNCAIMIDDAVKRHTDAIIYPNKTESELMKDAIADGDRWLLKFKPIFIEELKDVEHQVIRWQEWLAHSDFNKNLEFIKSSYQSHIEFRQAIDCSVREFLFRRFKQSQVDDVHLFEKYLADNPVHSQRCIDYLLEESAGYLLASQSESKYRYEIYPANKRNEALEAVYQFFIKPNNSNIMKFVPVCFSRSLQDYTPINTNKFPK